MIQRLQVQLTVLFAAFVLLVTVSVGVTYLGLQTQQQDALVINLSGRQRMLIHQMTRLVFQLQDGDETTFTALQESEQMFSQTLSALQNGGSAPYLTNSVVNLPVTRDSQILAALSEVVSSWGQFRSTLEVMISSAATSTSLKVTFEQQADDLVQKADVVVRLYETTSTAKVNRLRAIQVTFLMCALVLLGLNLREGIVPFALHSVCTSQGTVCGIDGSGMHDRVPQANDPGRDSVIETPPSWAL